MFYFRLTNLALTAANTDLIDINSEEKIMNILESMMKKSYEVLHLYCVLIKSRMKFMVVYTFLFL